MMTHSQLLSRQFIIALVLLLRFPQSSLGVKRDQSLYHYRAREHHQPFVLEKPGQLSWGVYPVFRYIGSKKCRSILFRGPIVHLLPRRLLQVPVLDQDHLDTILKIFSQSETNYKK